MKNWLAKNRWSAWVLFLIIGLAIGRLTSTSNDESATVVVEESASEIWTCSMHPQIRKSKPGKCPICNMELILVETEVQEEESNSNELQMSESAIKLAQIQTTVVTKQNPEKKVYLLGKVKPDERLIFSQTVHVPGRIEKLHINFTGEKVYKGQKLASIYSPELITAQKELFEVLNNPNINSGLLAATRNKLKSWKFSDQQIKQLEEKGELQTNIDILSDYTGYVFKRNVTLGDHVMEGQSLFQIIDLKNVWMMFEAYEGDLSWIKKGDEVEIEIRSLPGKMLKGKVNYIDPFINPQTRVASVRVELKNSNTLLKPDMFANGVIKAKLPMDGNALLIPKSAVLWTGKRAVVYVKVINRKNPTFVMREVVLGEDAGDLYVVREGLMEGEEIATHGVFRIDAAAQLAGKPSMMNPGVGNDKKEKKEDHSGHNMEKKKN